MEVETIWQWWRRVFYWQYTVQMLFLILILDFMLGGIAIAIASLVRIKTKHDTDRYWQAELERKRVAWSAIDATCVTDCDLCNHVSLPVCKKGETCQIINGNIIQRTTGKCSPSNSVEVSCQ